MGMFVNLPDIPVAEPFPGFRGRFIHTDHMTVAHWRISKGSELPEHSHPQEQIGNLMEGEFELSVAGDTQILRPGRVVVIPADVRHSGRALSDCHMIEIWYPSRDDLR